MKNVVLGAEIRGFPGEVTRERARSLVTRFGLAGYEDAYPSELSGGMRQRAALLRTLLCETDIILLDEPFASLDALSRVVMQEWLLGIREEFRRTMILITHDVDEALFLSNKVYVLSARPASVKDVVQVTLPRPRTHLVMETPEFVKLRAALLEPLWEEGAKSLNTELSAVRPGMVSTENV
jgi:ABC-type nitrate/sulfonate/bicarbonate transport system ATPase subunit